VVAAVGAGEDSELKDLSYNRRSYLGLRKMLQKTREQTTNPIAVNVMCALNNYDDLVKAAEDEGVDAIISGAGLPTRLPELVKSPDIKLIPVVSSGRAADLICRLWWKRYQRHPDALIVEGRSAGGHLGFSMEEMAQPATSLESIVKDVLAVTARCKQEYDFSIPVIAAGGIFTGADIAAFLRLGASGVQMGTRFVCTDECDASPLYKQAYLECKQEDIVIIRSPVKLPLRVIRNAFVDRMRNGDRKVFNCRYHCLHTCDPATSPYCIAQALKNAAEGNMAEGFVTCGSNAYRINRVVSVKNLIGELIEECLQALKVNPIPAFS